MRVWFVALFLFACSRVEEPNPIDHAAPAKSLASETSEASVSPSASSSSSAANTDVTTTPSVSASASASAPIATPFDGTWVFSRFDLDDPATAAKWSAVPADAQAEILSSAPQATLVIGKGTIVTKLAGIADKKSTFTVEGGATSKEATIATSDEGRKSLRLLVDGAMRVEDLGKKDSFVTIFVRKK